MNEKLLTVLVIVSLVLSVFNLVLMLRTNGTNTVTNILGQSSGVTWKKVVCQWNIDDLGNFYIYVKNQEYRYPLWNVTLAIQWNNGTMQTFNLGEAYYIITYSEYSGELSVYLPDSLEYANLHPYNITSVTAYTIQPPS